MAKSAKTGNIAVAGIQSTTTNKPTTSATLAKTATKNTGSSGTTGSSGSTGYTGTTGSTKSYSSSKSSGSSGSSSSSGSSGSGSSSSSTGTTTAAAEATTPSIAQQLYSTYSNGLRSSSGNAGAGNAGTGVTNTGASGTGATGIGTSGVGGSGANTSGSNAFDAAKAAAASRAIVNNAKASVPSVNVEKVKNVDATAQQKQLQELSEQQKEQAVREIDYATQTGVNELQRAYEDALPEYQTQRNQAAVEGQKALDNSVLYARQNGDRGGIGQAQYNSVQNNTANNIQSVNSAQVKLYTDTSRQVADLQAKGEYEKADKILSISQDYTEKLMELEKWATEQNVSIDEFNAKLDEWKAEYQLDVSKYLTDTELEAAEAAGAFSNGALTADTANAINDRYAAAGKAMLSAGVIPSDEQLSAMGWTPSQYWVYKMSQASADTAV